MKGWIIWLIVMTLLLIYNTVNITKWMDNIQAERLQKQALVDPAAMAYIEKVQEK